MLAVMQNMRSKIKNLYMYVLEYIFCLGGWCQQSDQTLDPSYRLVEIHIKYIHFIHFFCTINPLLLSQKLDTKNIYRR